MPLLDNFCTWFSIRMGSIIVAVVSLVQAILFLVLIIFTISQRDSVTSYLQQVMSQYDFLWTKFIVTYVRENIIFVTSVAVVFLVIYICSAVSLIQASYRLITWLIWPFLIFDFLRLLALSAVFVAGMAVIRKNLLNFNTIIVCLTVGGFYLLSQYYLWLCPVSLWQCISAMRNKGSRKKSKIMDINQFIFYDYVSDFPLKPIKPNRNYYQYQLGNLPKLYF